MIGRNCDLKVITVAFDPGDAVRALHGTRPISRFLLQYPGAFPRRAEYAGRALSALWFPLVVPDSMQKKHSPTWILSEVTFDVAFDVGE